MVCVYVCVCVYTSVVRSMKSSSSHRYTASVDFRSNCISTSASRSSCACCCCGVICDSCVCCVVSDRICEVCDVMCVVGGVWYYDTHTLRIQSLEHTRTRTHPPFIFLLHTHTHTQTYCVDPRQYPTNAHTHTHTHTHTHVPRCFVVDTPSVA
jgi:hypothetical protein